MSTIYQSKLSAIYLNSLPLKKLSATLCCSSNALTLEIVSRDRLQTSLPILSELKGSNFYFPWNHKKIYSSPMFQGGEAKFKRRYLKESWNLAHESLVMRQEKFSSPFWGSGMLNIRFKRVKAQINAGQGITW